MPFSFPASPSAGQQSTQNGRTYSWSGSAWELVAAGSGGTELFAYANTASFPGTGATTALYLSIASGRVYQWNGSVYSEVGPVGGGSLSGSVTIPGFADPFFSLVSLMLHMNGADGSTTFTDSSASPVTLTVYGNAKVSTPSKFGTGAALFDGTGDYLSVPTGSKTNFGTGDFSMEWWVRPSTLAPALQCVLGMQDNASDSAPIFRVLLTSDGLFSIALRGGALTAATGIGSSTPISANQWSHVAVTRASNVFRLYVNGTLESTVTPSSPVTLDMTLPIFIGSCNMAGSPLWDFSGSIDEIRFTKVARYTGAALSVPTAAFPDSADLTVPVVFT